jgi:predicted solute-binding protein
MSFPIITVTVEGMKESIHHAFMERQVQLSRELQIALDRECTSENIQLYIDEVTRKAVKDAVQDAIKRWWMTSEEGRKLIEYEVSKRMEEEAKHYRRSNHDHTSRPETDS